MTLSELITEVQALTGRENDTVLITQARVIRFLNEAQADISKNCLGHLDLETKDSDAITMVAGTYEYSFASLTPAVLYPLRLFYMDGAASQQLEYLDTDEFDEDFPNPASLASGIPTEWTRRGSTIEIYPVPTASEAGKYIRLDYTKKPTPFAVASLSASCSMLDADQGLLYYAISEAFAAIGSKDADSVSFKQRYLAWIEDYRKDKDGLYMAEGNGILNC